MCVCGETGWGFAGTPLLSNLMGEGSGTQIGTVPKAPFAATGHRPKEVVRGVASNGV